jgi:hypothetical protein
MSDVQPHQRPGYAAAATRMSRHSNMRAVIDNQPRDKHDARVPHIRPFDPSIIYFTLVKYSGIIQAHCRDAVSRYRACYCKKSGDTAAERAETN